MFYNLFKLNFVRLSSYFKLSTSHSNLEVRLYAYRVYANVTSEIKKENTGLALTLHSNSLRKILHITRQNFWPCFYKYSNVVGAPTATKQLSVASKRMLNAFFFFEFKSCKTKCGHSSGLMKK